MVLTKKRYILGDSVYLIRRNRLAPYNGAQLTQGQKDCNSSMSKVRVTLEWVFGEVINNFKFTDFKKS